jgi:hypothetical protein
MKIITSIALCSVAFSSTLLANPPAAGDSCFNVGSNQVINAGTVGSATGSFNGQLTDLFGSSDVTCADITGVGQVNATLQASFAAGIPVSVGVGHHAGGDAGIGAGNGSYQGNYSEISKFCAGSTVFNSYYSHIGYTKQLNIQNACSGNTENLYQIPFYGHGGGH